jgi:periplasmic protein TonB
MIRNTMPYFISVMIHLLLTFSIISVSKCTVTKTIENAPVIIDFSIDNTHEETLKKSPLKAPVPPAPKTSKVPDQLSSVAPSQTQQPNDTEKVIPDTFNLNDSQKQEYSENIPAQKTDSAIGSSDEQSISHYIKEEFSYIRKIIVSNIIYPQNAQYRRQEGTLLLSFVIMLDGSVSDIKIVKSSGYDLLDKNAISTIKKSAPFPKPPFLAELKMPVTYKLF